MWTKLTGAVALLATTTACESGTFRSLQISVSDEVAADYDADRMGILLTNEGGVGGYCGETEVSWQQDTDFSCRPDDPDVVVEAWIVRVPEGWELGCDEALDCELHPYDAVPERTEDDPFGATDAHWRWTPICGGNLEATVVIER